MKFSFYPLFAGAMCLSVLPATIHATERQHGKHEHGVAELQVAIEHEQLLIQLHSPLFNLAGFGAARTTEQQQQLATLYEQLQHADELFTFDGATCTSVNVSIQGIALSTLDDHEDDDHQDDEAEHHEDDEHKDDEAEHHEDDEHKDGEAEHHEDDEHKDGEAEHHEDDEHKDGEAEHHEDDEHEGEAEHHEHDEHDADEEDHHDHDAHDGDEESSHTDVEVIWHLTCTDIANLQHISVGLFQAYPSMQHIDAQYLTGDGQGAQRLTPENAQLNF